MNTLEKFEKDQLESLKANIQKYGIFYDKKYDLKQNEIINIELLVKIELTFVLPFSFPFSSTKYASVKPVFSNKSNNLSLSMLTETTRYLFLSSKFSTEISDNKISVRPLEILKFLVSNCLSKNECPK